MNTTENYGLVFGGGGARGAYQIGVWQALKKINLTITAVVGTSIGAINGALYVQNDLDVAKKIWRTVTLEQIIKLEEPLQEPDNLFDIKNLQQLIHQIFSKRGVDTTPLRKMMQERLDENKIRQSPIDYGMVSYSVDDRKPCRLFKGDIPEGMLLDYILASAALPVFKPVEIDGKKHIDGAVYDNLPASMLIERGFRKLILVDISPKAINKDIPDGPYEIIRIRPKRSLGGVLDLDRKQIAANIRLGYLDALRVFGKATGKHFSIHARSYGQYLDAYDQDVLDGLEEAGRVYGLRDDRIYSMQRLQKTVVGHYIESRAKYRHLKEEISLSKLDKELLLPAAVDVLNDVSDAQPAKEFMLKLVPSTLQAAKAIVALGINKK